MLLLLQLCWGAMDQTLIRSILVDLKQLPTNTDQIEVTEKNTELKDWNLKI